MCMCESMCVCMHLLVCVRVCVCVHVYVCVYVLLGLSGDEVNAKDKCQFVGIREE